MSKDTLPLEQDVKANVILGTRSSLVLEIGLLESGI